jgi:hypothetical protein
MENKLYSPDGEYPQVGTYSISKEQFLAPAPAVVAPYNGQWTRENFPRAVKSNFAKSRGSIMAQYALVEWQRLNQGFDYVTTFQNYLHAQGHRALSRPEQDHMLHAFNSVEDHTFRAVDTRREKYLNQAKRTVHVIADFVQPANEKKREPIRPVLTREEVLGVIDVTLEKLVQAQLTPQDPPVFGTWEELRGMEWNDFITQLHTKLVPEKKQALGK